MLTESDNELRNPLLYRYVEMAYQYVKELDGVKMEGNAAQAVEQLQRRRMQCILGIDLSSNDLRSESRPRLVEQVTGSLETQQLAIVQGRITDFIVPDNMSRIFDEQRDHLERAFEQDQSKTGVLREFGLDAYASYLPIHFFFTPDHRITDWGVYISEPHMLRLAARLAAAFQAAYGPPADPLGTSGFIELAYQILLRHELMHFKLESFALNAEMTSRKALYARYLMQVYIQDYLTDDCLEEGLANSAILLSEAINRFVNTKLYPHGQRRNRTEKIDWRSIVIGEFLDHQPHGYRNYDLAKGPHNPDERHGFGRRQEAANYISNQIMTGDRRPTTGIPFYAYPPDNYFLRAEHLVPIHIVRSMDERTSFIESLTLPTCRCWKRFLKDLGYKETERGKGVHVVWKGPPGRGDIVVDCHDKELDYNAFKQGLKTLGLHPKDFRSYLVTGTLPQRLHERVAAYEENRYA